MRQIEYIKDDQHERIIVGTKGSQKEIYVILPQSFYKIPTTRRGIVHACGLDLVLCQSSTGYQCPPLFENAELEMFETEKSSDPPRPIRCRVIKLFYANTNKKVVLYVQTYHDLVRRTIIWSMLTPRSFLFILQRCFLVNDDKRRSLFLVPQDKRSQWDQRSDQKRDKFIQDTFKIIKDAQVDPTHPLMAASTAEDPIPDIKHVEPKKITTEKPPAKEKPRVKESKKSKQHHTPPPSPGAPPVPVFDSPAKRRFQTEVVEVQTNSGMMWSQV